MAIVIVTPIDTNQYPGSVQVNTDNIIMSHMEDDASQPFGKKTTVTFTSGQKLTVVGKGNETFQMDIT